MSRQEFSKSDLKETYDLYFDAIRGFMYYKTGDIQLAEDLVQEVFIKVWEKRETIRKESVKSLLYTIANNLMINHYNHLKVVREHQSGAAIADKDNQTPQFQLETKEFEVLLNSVIADMPDGSREVFWMNRIDKLKYDEIASRLDLSVKAVEKRMAKALAIVREKLGRKV